VKLLLEKGTKLEAKSKNGWMPLSLAIWNRHKVVIKLLLKKGAKLETKDNNYS
jgi:ankyrin repeat protein